jgi:hypothetical protein
MDTRTHTRPSHFAKRRLGLRIAFAIGVAVGLFSDRDVAAGRAHATLASVPTTAAFIVGD